MKPTIKWPKCYNTDLYKFGKDKKSNQKHLCKKCRRQFTLQSTKKYLPRYSKCPVYGKGTYLHHKYTYYVIFKCNDRKCNHKFKQIIPTAIDDQSSEKLNGKALFSGHRAYYVPMFLQYQVFMVLL